MSEIRYIGSKFVAGLGVSGHQLDQRKATTWSSLFFSPLFSPFLLSPLSTGQMGLLGNKHWMTPFRINVRGLDPTDP